MHQSAIYLTIAMTIFTLLGAGWRIVPIAGLLYVVNLALIPFAFPLLGQYFGPVSEVGPGHVVLAGTGLYIACGMIVASGLIWAWRRNHDTLEYPPGLINIAIAVLIVAGVFISDMRIRANGTHAAGSTEIAAPQRAG